MKFRFLPHIAVQAPNIGEAKKFYIEVLGMNLLSENSAEVKLSTADAIFYVEESKDREVCFAFEVDSLEGARQLLIDNNCVITSENKEGFMVSDPHGLSYFVSQAPNG
jgi:hypothetical protein